MAKNSLVSSLGRTINFDVFFKIKHHYFFDCNGQVVPHYYIYQIISVVSQVLDWGFPSSVEFFKTDQFPQEWLFI